MIVVLFRRLEFIANFSVGIYKGYILADAMATVPGNGAYLWDVSLTLALGQDYSIKIKSSLDENMAGSSDAVFAIQ